MKEVNIMSDATERAVRQLLLEQPNLAFFYILYVEYTTGSIGDSTFHSLVTDAQSCRAAVQQLCAEQKAKWEEEVAEIQALPPDEEPYDPFLPDGCSASLCIVLPDKASYVRIENQRWYNNGQSLHSAEKPDIFAVAYYRDKVGRGDYHNYNKINV
jgi:hypothetical protein